MNRTNRIGFQWETGQQVLERDNILYITPYPQLTKVGFPYKQWSKTLRKSVFLQQKLPENALETEDTG